LIDADDLARRPDQFGNGKRDVAGAGTEIEDAHPRADTGCLEQHPRGRRKHLALVVETPQFGGVAAKVVSPAGRVGHFAAEARGAAFIVMCCTRQFCASPV
jgi:hypothetical protein